MTKKAFFYIDDVIWVFRDLTRQRPQSIFDHHFLKPLKEAHDKYGAKVQLNVFYRTDFFYGNDEFTLADMTDAYKTEWEEASDWLKIGFHSKQEFPDYPFINISYQDMKDIYLSIKQEIIRFAGENSFAKFVLPHWVPVSKEGCKALRDCGAEIMCYTSGVTGDYNGDPASLAYGHAGRLLQNRQPETRTYTRRGVASDISRGICGYNHRPEDQAALIRNTLQTIRDPETGLHFKGMYGVCLNLTKLEDLETASQKFIDCEFVPICSHEQYCYADYFAYQPDHPDKVLNTCNYFFRNGYTFIHAEELLDLKD